MSSIIIKAKDKKQESLLIQLANALNMSIRVLDEDDEQDLLLIQSIDKGLKSGKASKEEVNKLFAKNGIRIQ